MRMSARLLGQGLGLTAQELNALLREQGFLEGKPGAYSVTEKGEKYAAEQDHHRGPGGYSWYNRDWTTRTWDPSIAGELDSSEHKKQHIREQVAEARRAAREQAKNTVELQSDQNSSDQELDARPLIVIGGVVATGIGIYKAAPHVKRFMSEKVAPRLKKWTDRSTPEAVKEEVVSPDPLD